MESHLPSTPISETQGPSTSLRMTMRENIAILVTHFSAKKTGCLRSRPRVKAQEFVLARQLFNNLT